MSLPEAREGSLGPCLSSSEGPPPPAMFLGSLTPLHRQVSNTGLSLPHAAVSLLLSFFSSSATCKDPWDAIDLSGHYRTICPFHG